MKTKKNLLDYVVAIIPARGGSKRLPKKNIYEFRGKPMIYWSILAANKSKIINDVFVTSDNKDILNIAHLYKSKTIKRPKNISDDKTFKMEAIKHAVLEVEKEKKPSLVISLQANSPEVSSLHLDKAIKHLIKFDLHEVISVDKNLVQNGAIRAMRYHTVFQEALSVHLGAIRTNITDIHTLSDIKSIEKKKEGING